MLIVISTGILNNEVLQKGREIGLDSMQQGKQDQWPRSKGRGSAGGKLLRENIRAKRDSV